jgi:hypothetical protein
MPSFGIVSQFNSMELENAVNQAKKELASRFDFKGSKAEIVLEKNEIKLSAEDQFRIKALEEMVMGKVKEALAKSEKPERKQQAAGWKVFKANEAPPNGVIYMLITDPVAKGTDYSLQQILTEGFGPTDGYNLAKTLADSATGQQLFNLKLILDLK